MVPSVARTAAGWAAFPPEITAAGIRHYEAPLHRRTLSDMRRSLAVLREVIRTEKPDVVHAHARIPAFLCGRLQKSMGFPSRLFTM